VSDQSQVQRWLQTRTFHHSAFAARRLATERDCSVAVCLPARECAHTVGAIVDRLSALVLAGVIDDIVVVDAASSDGTAEIARAAGARVVQEQSLLPQFGPVRGKGDAMWRALSVIEEDIVCYVDADSYDFAEHFVLGLLGPLIDDEEIEFVKAFYRRPFTAEGVVVPDGGGRVNELMARPALAMFYPRLAGVRQPLAGEVAARRGLLERIPYATGYGVETAMLLDVEADVGLDAIAQVDLGERRNTHQPLHALSPMAFAVLEVIARRLEREGRLADLDPGGLTELDGELRRGLLEERPPIVSVT
jgi:glucosyl-3-phosphoglycerate synthase